MNTQTRAGMLALAGTARPRGAARRGRAHRQAPSRPRSRCARLRRRSFALRAAGTGGADAKKANGPLARRVERLAAPARRARARRPRFPVDGAFNWGQQAARFGAGRGGRSHEGQDVFARTGTPLVAVRDGVVLETGNDGGRGNYVAIYSPRGRATYVYLHMSRLPRWASAIACGAASASARLAAPALAWARTCTSRYVADAAPARPRSTRCRACGGGRRRPPPRHAAARRRLTGRHNRRTFARPAVASPECVGRPESWA